MKNIRWVLVVCAMIMSRAGAQDFRKVVDIVSEMEGNLKKMIAEEKTQRAEEVTAFRGDLEKLRESLTSVQSQPAVDTVALEQRLQALEKRVAELSKPAVEPKPAVPSAPSAWTWTFTERVRMESWDNMTSFSRAANQNNSYFRYRTNVQLQWMPVKEFDVTVRLANEFRSWFAPLNKEFTWHEVFFDLLSARWTADPGIPVTLTVGRQALNMGEGFVVYEGTPLDGSRGYSFDAVRADVAFSPVSKLTLFATDVNRLDKRLPVLNRKDQLLTDSEVSGWGVFGQTEISGIALQPYILHRTGQAFGAIPFVSVTMFGGRVRVPVTTAFAWTTEAGFQTGKTGASDHEALGGYSIGEYKTGWSGVLPHTLLVRVLYLSGDDAKTTTHDEAWDPMFGRWPKWSEGYSATLSKEGGSAYWTNLGAVSVGIRSTVTSVVDVSLDYWRMTAPSGAAAGKAFPGGMGKVRGDLVAARVAYKLSSVVAGHCIWEHFVPGDYFFTGAGEANWARIEFLFTF